MIDLTLDMEQYDCPFIATTDDHDVSFTAVQWGFDGVRRELETRMVVDGGDRGSLEAGLDALTAHRNMRECDLYRKRDGTAFIRTIIDETNAMGVIRAHDGYITGPFRIEGGSERWKVGFDRSSDASDALAELERHNEFAEVDRESLSPDRLFDLLENAEAASELLDACRDLSAVERHTLAVAAEMGYFEQPREANLQSLAEEFGVSDTAVSKNLRRAERKLLAHVVRALDQVE